MQHLSSILPKSGTINAVVDINSLHQEILLTTEEIDTAVEKVRKSRDKFTEAGLIKGELTPEDIDQIKYEMRSKKAAQINLKRYAEKIKNPTQYKKFTAVELLLKYRKAGLELDQWNRHIVKTLCRYFAGEPAPEKRNAKGELLPPAYSLNKGIYIFGGVGCGKTELLSFFRRNSHNPYLIKPCLDLALEYQNNGADAITKYDGLIKTSDPAYYYGHSKLGLCLEDLGTEEDKKNFGNLSNVIADIFLKRYAKLYDYDKNPVLVGKTHITTNLSMSEIKERYGSRFHSRITEMCNVFAFDPNAPDRRKFI